MKLREYILDFIDKCAVKYTVWNWHRKHAALDLERERHDWESHCKSCNDWEDDCICP